MSELQLGVPIEIDGQEVIIFRDVIGTEAIAHHREEEIFTVVEPQSPDGRPPIYIDENELRNLRDNYPGTNVYGLWQILFANDLVPLGNEVIIFPTGETSGVYLQMAAGADLSNPSNILRSSEYLDNYLPDLVDYDLFQATRLRVNLQDLKLPAVPAFTRVELFAKQKHEETKRWYVVASICIVLASVAAIYNYSMYSIFNMNMAEYTTKKQQAADLDSRITALLKERLQVVPNNSVAIDRIMQLAVYDPEISTSTNAGQLNGFTGNHVLLTRHDFPVDLAQKVPGVKSRLTPNMAYELTVSSEPALGGGL